MNSIAANWQSILAVGGLVTAFIGALFYEVTYDSQGDNCWVKREKTSVEEEEEE